MFSKILIANRGEIACRVISTARRMGIKTVAVYSEADARAQHVLLADEAVSIGPAPAAQSYLAGRKIIEATRGTAAEAIHPGYGFLSENPDFVEAVEAAGLRFIGPTAKAIRAMGLKDEAKRLMEAAGVPVVPGYHGSRQDADFLKQQAEAIGYPVLIKASAGGGGKGMRRVDAAADFLDALESCRREALASFGDERFLIEKFISSPRHIEVQIFGDSHGNVVHLFERDCSLQRRHQKVIEEAPAPGMTPAVRAAMTEAAIKAAKAVGYQGAGTIEFIADGSGALRADRFWFMEMNTRLQVEHPVTEAITGLDLVEWQLRIAAGEALPLDQASISISGHAVEARLYAEDPASGFLPQAGRIDYLEFTGGEGIRVDGGVAAGDQVSPFYDPMISKVIAHGANREAAIARLRASLDETLIAGLVTNRDFLRALCNDKQFHAGEMDTGLIERNLETLLRKPVLSECVIAIAALQSCNMGIDAPRCGFRLWGKAEHRVSLVQGGTLLERRLLLEPGQITLTGGISEIRLCDIRMGSQIEARLVSGELRRQIKAQVVRTLRDDTMELTVLYDGERFVFTVPDVLIGTDVRHGDAGDIIAPMTGIVRMIGVKKGDQVKVGDRLAVMEAMKMEHTLTAAQDGMVIEVFGQPESAVEGGTTLIRIGAVER